MVHTGPASPHAPTPLEGVTVDATSATIRWVVPTIAYTQETYTVSYGKASDQLYDTSGTVEGSIDITVNNSAYEVRITGLDCYTTYYYQVVATNAIGSTASGTLSFQTATARKLMLNEYCILTKFDFNV